MMHKVIQATAILIISAGLSACGGGGGETIVTNNLGSGGENTTGGGGNTTGGAESPETQALYTLSGTKETALAVSGISFNSGQNKFTTYNAEITYNGVTDQVTLPEKDVRLDDTHPSIQGLEYIGYIDQSSNPTDVKFIGYQTKSEDMPTEATAVYTGNGAYNIKGAASIVGNFQGNMDVRADVTFGGSDAGVDVTFSNVDNAGDYTITNAESIKIDNLVISGSGFSHGDSTTISVSCFNTVNSSLALGGAEVSAIGFLAGTEAQELVGAESAQTTDGTSVSVDFGAKR